MQNLRRPKDQEKKDKDEAEDVVHRMERLKIERALERNRKDNEGGWGLTDAEMAGCKHRAKISGRPLQDHIAQVCSSKMAMHQSMADHRIRALRKLDTLKVCCLFCLIVYL